MCNGATVFQWTYTTDAVGNPTAIADALNAANNRTYSYQDYQYFLTQGDGPWGNQSWTYDQIGNRLTETKAGGTDTYAYVTNGGGGNTAILVETTLAATGTREYAFGPAGHLERVTAPGNEILFTTDPAGRLSRLDRAAGDAAADFLYDGRSFLRSSEAGTVTSLFEDGFESGDASCWDGSLGGTGLNAGTADCSPQPEAEPVYSSDGLLHAVTTRPDIFTETTRYYLQFAGRPVAQLDVPSGGGTATYLWFTTDHLGTPVLATDDAGVTVWEGGFEPFGQDWSGASAAGIELRFPGQWMDESWRDASEGARGYYNLHRWYESGTGTYARPDPLPIEILREAQYAYVSANPWSAVDPLGLAAFKPCSELASPRPCQCDKERLAEAPSTWRKFRDEFCKFRNSAERPPAVPKAGEGAETIRKIDPPLGPVYRHLGDPCREFCTCEHERDLDSPRVRKLLLDGIPTQQLVNWLECRAYYRGTFCLQGFARGGIP